ncbi:hypothetical protein [Streptomyces sp. NPDC058678]|uniref:hypothetical protein n=1 Tax=Streptomyces sp. NPDC058678 TaxID=3346595 RepID=UPI003660075F
MESICAPLPRVNGCWSATVGSASGVICGLPEAVSIFQRPSTWSWSWYIAAASGAERARSYSCTSSIWPGKKLVATPSMDPAPICVGPPP